MSNSTVVHQLIQATNVVEKMSQKFVEMGVDESVLSDLQHLWEEKIRSSGVAQFVEPVFYPVMQQGFMFNLPQQDGPADIKKLPQTDGLDDDDDEDDDVDEQADRDSQINSDLDDDDDDDENADLEHLILCQYEKVTRIKNKWRCVLKDGIVHVNGKDYLFNRVIRLIQGKWRL
ncbi:transcription factor IIA, alpha/beta subunit-domain-containing protein [Gorgonomyces haynaldii]|nr:transcription factor IIA, alpha/beta subunit-domain-containing protein [Gorgonomyces haynaldii]